MQDLVSDSRAGFQIWEPIVLEAIRSCFLASSRFWRATFKPITDLSHVDRTDSISTVYSGSGFDDAK